MSLNGKVITGNPLTGIHPAEVDDSGNGISVDFNNYGSLVMAIQMIGPRGGANPVLEGKIQESSNGSTWTDITGATFTQVTGSNKIETITFTRTMRYLRHVRTVTGVSPTFILAVSFTPLDPTECIYTKGERCIYAATQRIVA